MSWYWHDISDKDSVRYATYPAVWVGYWIAVAGGLVGVFSLVLRKPIAGMSGWTVVDASLFAIVGWRIAHLSRAWSVVGLFLILLETVFATLEMLPEKAIVAPIMFIIFLTTYINAVRGAFAHHKYLKLQSTQPADSAPKA